MSSVSAAPADRPMWAIAAGGVAAGVLDILAAFIVYGLRGAVPVRILQSIASGLLGAAAFRGGMRTAALGLVLHFLNATIISTAYFLLSRRAPVLVRRPLSCGAVYGVVVYCVMNFIVVPLSAVAKRPFAPGLATILVGVHIACVGVPIALAVRRFAGSVASAGARTVAQ